MRRLLLGGALLLACAPALYGADLTEKLKTGDVKLKSAGPIAFAPEGILLVADPKAATISGIATGDVSATAKGAKYAVEDIGEKLAGALGVTTKEIVIADMAINPLSGNAYFSIQRGQGAEAAAVILRVTPEGKVEEVKTEGVRTTSVTLPNPGKDETGPRGQNPRTESITDLAYINGKVWVAGLSNEEFASKLRGIPFPFEKADNGASVEIYHGAHGAVETRSPVRTFAAFNISGEDHLIAAYTCTPLVKFPIGGLKDGDKVRGTTIAELGNRNKPLDMVVYQKDGKNFVLLANSSRGVMKIKTDEIEKVDAITSRIADKAGLPYDTLAELKGVEQLDRLNETMVAILTKSDDGKYTLTSIELP
jgi:hypothetical protein